MRTFRVTVYGQVYEVGVEEVDNAVAPVSIAQPVTPAPLVQEQPAPVQAKPQVIATQISGAQIKSPMPGTILRVDVSVGQSVKKGDVLCILEAMKMENEIMAPNDAVIVGVHVQAGASVQPGDTLLTLDQ